MGGRWYSKITDVGFHLAQALTGHGCFQGYLLKRKRAPSPTCFLCGHEDDTAEHTLFLFPHWTSYRDEAKAVFGKTLTPEDVPDIILGPAQHLLHEDSHARAGILSAANRHRDAFVTLVSAILSSKEEIERERQRLDAP